MNKKPLILSLLSICLLLSGCHEEENTTTSDSNPTTTQTTDTTESTSPEHNEPSFW